MLFVVFILFVLLVVWCILDSWTFICFAFCLMLCFGCCGVLGLLYLWLLLGDLFVFCVDCLFYFVLVCFVC